MTAAYDQVVAALPHLTPEERGKIKQRLDMLQSIASTQTLTAAVEDAKPATGSDLADDLLAAICAEVMRASGERANPHQLRRTPQFRSFREKAEALEPFVRDNTSDRTERRALLSVAVRLLYDTIVTEGLAASARTLMLHVHRAPAVLDRAFPGYAASGWLIKVIKVDRTASEG